MKTITILSLAAALTGIAAAETPAATTTPAQTVPATPAAASTEQAAPAKTGTTKQEAETLLKDMMSTLSDLTAAMEGVTDKATADAAAPKVAEIAANLQALQSKAEKMGEPSPEVQKEIMEQYSKQLEETVGKFLQASMKVGMANFYGSESLTKVFQAMNAGSGNDDDDAAPENAAPAPADK